VLIVKLLAACLLRDGEAGEHSGWSGMWWHSRDSSEEKRKWLMRQWSSCWLRGEIGGFASKSQYSSAYERTSNTWYLLKYSSRQVLVKANPIRQADDSPSLGVSAPWCSSLAARPRGTGTWQRAFPSGTRLRV